MCNEADPFDFDAEIAKLEDSEIKVKPKPSAKQVDSNYNAGVDANSNVVRLRPVRKNPKKSVSQVAAEIRKNHNKLLEAKTEFNEQNPGLVKFLRENAHWSDFFASLVSQFESKGTLSDKQIRAARSGQSKVLQNQERKRKEREANKVQADLSSIKAMFDAARETGLMRTRYIAEGLELSAAPSNGRNPGAIYVVRLYDNQYLGKVIDRVFSPMHFATGEDKQALARIAADPKEAAVRWGQKTGTCSCCGRELTNKDSIKAGIGPICARKWNL